MLLAVMGILHYGFALIFGMLVSALLAGIEFNRKNKWILAILGVALFVIQTFCGKALGFSMTQKLYPLMVHIPIICILVFYHKKPWYISLVSLLSSYLFCQIPRWFGFVGKYLLDNKLAEHTFYILAMVLLYFLMKKHVIEVLRQLMEVSRKSCLLWGGVPIIYYIFDNVTTIYTDILYSGERWVMQFLPVVLSTFYFISTTLYYTEVEKEMKMQRERDRLDMQFKMAQTEFSSMRELQQTAMAYRHDMRHHFSYLQGLAERENIKGIKEYLQNAWSDLDAITPRRFCENESLNLLLSAYATKAKEKDIRLRAEIISSDVSVFSDTELCSLFSNALENAIYACEEISEKEKREIFLKVYRNKQKLCIELRNTCHKEPVFQNDIPVPKKIGHGYGTKSMVHIIEKYEGICRFSYEDGWFIFQAIV